MSATGEATIRMANQIARNFETVGKEAAIAATAEHIQSYWDPRMKAAAFALLKEDRSLCSAIAGEALHRLESGEVGADGQLKVG